ncbi:hypothetical protein E3U36_05840 [Arsenophonus endosymbiont of Aphis craccivora]|uniref:hypothetical protein n=1 Tax=Arsenophonus endosymbiont of Aphis craccivora TaxID=1231049 RepID=UPI0015DD4527|nr:hypothetical protein [Arsenophonus endosymbiont of Aphis craccivora]QLK87771.1 hypothetical protein E3U36_05840 [Arsenophonus endosymbiont of Aphis craccivora]
MPWGPDVETNLAISSANHLKVRFIQQSPNLVDLKTHLFGSRYSTIANIDRSCFGKTIKCF